MLDRSQTRIVIILGLLGFFSCILSLYFLSNYSAIDFVFPIEKEEIFNSVDRFISLQKGLSSPLVKKASVQSNQKAIIYFQKKLGSKQTESFLGRLPLYYWQVEYVLSDNENFPLLSQNVVRILVDPVKASIIGFSRSIPKKEYEHRRIILEDEAKEIAQDFFNAINFDISNFKKTKYSPVEGRHIFEWEKELVDFKRAKLNVKLDIVGDVISKFHYFLNIPEAEIGGFRVNEMVNTILFAILNILVFCLGIFVLIISFIKRKKIEWRFGLIFALLMALAFLINFLKLEYRRDLYLFLFLVILVIGCVIDFFWTLIISGVSKLLAKESGINLFPIRLSYSILLSYIFFFSGIGFTMVFFVVVIKTVNPVATLGFDSFFSEFPSAKISCLLAPFLSLGAAVFEEVFFRALLISFLKKYFKSTIWLILLSSLIWCFMHVSPIGYSDIYPGFVKGIILLPIGLLFGYIFIRFGLVCAIVTHYLHDLIVIGSSYLKFTNFRYVNENITVMLISAILPILIAYFVSLKEKNA